RSRCPAGRCCRWSRDGGRPGGPRACPGRRGRPRPAGPWPRAERNIPLMAFVTVARVEDIPPGTCAHVQAGEAEIAVANVGDAFYATHGHCLHLKGPL